MRPDYAADKAEIDREKARQDAYAPRAASLRDEIDAFPWDDSAVASVAWIRSEVLAAIESYEDLTYDQIAGIRRRLGWEGK